MYLRYIFEIKSTVLADEMGIEYIIRKKNRMTARVGTLVIW